ncbi:MAG: peptidylprolyl isomerase [Ferruginibacter sp.]
MKQFKILMTALFMSVISFSVQAQVKKTTAPKPKATATPANPKKPVTKPKTVTPKPVVPKTNITDAATTRVKITTDSGIIIVKLYDSTPLHRDNFIKLVNQGFYDSLLFHRVIQGFMIQGGDPLSKNAAPGQQLGMGGGDMERIPAEFRPGIIHKKGALAAARDGNPQRASSACQFYLVQGKPATDEELNNFEAGQGRKYTPEQRAIYKTIGGVPFLDMNYTVFGEVVSGLEVIDKIASVPKAPGDRPIGDVHMKMEIVK